jgi:hypothetical protein
MAKDKTSASASFSSIDEGAALMVWKRVFYQLTKEEGWDGLGTPKVPAVVVAVTQGERVDGTLVADLFIMRSAALGGAFSKDNVPFDNGRNNGTFDNIQSSDSKV